VGTEVVDCMAWSEVRWFAGSEESREQQSGFSEAGILFTRPVAGVDRREMVVSGRGGMDNGSPVSGKENWSIEHFATLYGLSEAA